MVREAKPHYFIDSNVRALSKKLTEQRELISRNGNAEDQRGYWGGYFSTVIMILSTFCAGTLLDK